MKLIFISRRTISLVIIPCFFIVLILSILFVNKQAGNFLSVLVNSISSSDDNNPPVRKGKLAIIIDDFGQSRSGVNEMMSINRHLTFAIMPFLAFSQSDAVKAYNKGYEVIVHLPMEATGGKPSWVGPRPILWNMNSDEVKQLVNDAFKDVPYAVGANIHMGSRASGSSSIMSYVLEVIKEKNVYFVDSRTCKKPITKGIADTMGVRCFDRDIFLDEKRPKSLIKKQLRKACNVALKKGRAIAIGHVGTEGGRAMAEAISEMLDEFDRNNVELVFVSEL